MHLGLFGPKLHLGIKCCCCKVRTMVLLQRPAETRWRDGHFFSTTQRVDFGCILFSNEPVSCTPKFLNCWMGPGQASTQDQSVQALMIHLCELKKCVGTLQWAEPQSTLRQKIPTRVGCIHRRGCVVFTLGYIGGYRVYGLNPELEPFHPFPRFRFFLRFFSIQNRLPEMHLFPPLPAFQPLPCFQ